MKAHRTFGLRARRGYPGNGRSCRFHVGFDKTKQAFKFDCVPEHDSLQPRCSTHSVGKMVLSPLPTIRLFAFLLAIYSITSMLSFHAFSETALSDSYPGDLGIGKDKSVVFADDFESDNLKKWDDFDGNPEPFNHLMPASGPLGLNANHVVRLRAPSGKRGGADLVKVLPEGYDRLYARWYVKYEPGFNFNAPNHGGGLHAGSRNLLGRSDNRPEGNDWFCAWIEHTTDTHRNCAYVYYRGMYQDCADPHGRCWGDHFPAKSDGPFAGKPQHQPRISPPVLESGKWYCVEIMMDGGNPGTTENGANGVLDYWIDGVEIGPWNDLWLRTTGNLKIDIFWLNLFHHDGTHSDEGILIDNVVVATKRIGIGRPLNHPAGHNTGN